MRIIKKINRIYLRIRVTRRFVFRKIKDNIVLLMITGAVTGFLVALLIIFFEELPYVKNQALVPCIKCKIDDTEGLLNRYPNFLTWIMLFLIQTGIAISLGLASYQNIYVRILKNFRIRKSDIIVSLALVVIMMVVTSCSYIIPFNNGEYYKWPRLPLNHLYTKIVILLALSIIPASCSVLGMILIGCVCWKIGKESLPDNIMDTYIELRESLERFLLLTGIILTSGMITVYFFYASVQSMHQGDLFTKHSLTIFGLLFSIFIALTFIPSKLLLNTLGRKIINKFHAHPSADMIPKIKEWVEARRAMEEYLSLKVNSVENFKDVLTVLTPAIGSFLPGLLT